ncbi:hypothetical protein [Burkholderia gladioli]|uniref:hypothetical protein n=1 Tax=Burkholderia gladioli TaxID=28095 RepID=UPI001641F702|nr:hypothetical protein [Burkholderia gladioli]
MKIADQFQLGSRVLLRSMPGRRFLEGKEAVIVRPYSGEGVHMRDNIVAGISGDTFGTNLYKSDVVELQCTK